MSEPNTPSYPPPPPPSYTPPPAGGASSNRTLMLVLAYLGILAIIPLVAEKNDREVQWHAKNGLVILVSEIALLVVFVILSHIPGVGCLTLFMFPLLSLIFLAVAVFGIIKAVNGQRLVIPGLSDFADRF
jgi:uncharacterized membrane protein